MTPLRSAVPAALALVLATCGEPAPVKDKIYYLAHREELEGEAKACRDTGRVATDAACQRLAAIRTEILKAEVGARIQAR